MAHFFQNSFVSFEIFPILNKFILDRVLKLSLSYSTGNSKMNPYKKHSNWTRGSKFISSVIWPSKWEHIFWFSKKIRFFFVKSDFTYMPFDTIGQYLSNEYSMIKIGWAVQKFEVHSHIAKIALKVAKKNENFGSKNNNLQVLLKRVLLHGDLSTIIEYKCQRTKKNMAWFVSIKKNKMRRPYWKTLYMSVPYDKYVCVMEST